MKKSNNKDISISDLANEFHVSKSSIELYGIHRLLPPIPDNKSKPAYRPLDKARLKFIAKAKNADYTIGNIKDLIGVLDLDKSEGDQIEESLVYGKKKAAEFTDNLEDLDALEQINAACDLELLEAYITDLNNIKYGLDIATIKAAPPDPRTETSHAKPRTLVYSHIDNQINTAAPVIAPKTSRRSLLVVAGVFVVAISVYLYSGSDPVSEITDNQVAPIQREPAEMKAATAASNEADEINLSETDTNADKNNGTQADEPDSTEDSVSLLDFPALKSESNSPSADSMENMPETYSDEQTQNTKNTQALLDGINESEETKPTPNTPEKEETEDVFFKQLVADLKKKYDEQAQSQKPATNDTTEIDVTPEKMSEKKETQNLAAVAIPNDASQADKTTTATAKTPLIKTATTPPKKVAPVARTQAPISSNTGTSFTNAGVPLQSAPSSKPTSSAIQTGSSTEQAKASTEKTEPATRLKRDESANKAITSTIPKPKPESEPEPAPKPKTIPQKPANPEALKWVQKSYESVMSGDAGEAIIAASVAITLDPNLVNAYINRSWAYSKKGLYDRAIQDCDKALDIDNENALAYNNRGLAFQGKGDLDKAMADYERSCKLGFDIGCKNYQEVVGSKADNS